MAEKIKQQERATRAERVCSNVVRGAADSIRSAGQGDEFEGFCSGSTSPVKQPREEERKCYLQVEYYLILIEGRIPKLGLPRLDQRKRNCKLRGH